MTRKVYDESLKWKPQPGTSISLDEFIKATSEFEVARWENRRVRCYRVALAIVVGMMQTGGIMGSTVPGLDVVVDGIPPDCRVLAVSLCYASDSLFFWLEHPSFEPVAAGETPLAAYVIIRHLVYHPSTETLEA